MYQLGSIGEQDEGFYYALYANVPGYITLLRIRLGRAWGPRGGLLSALCFLDSRNLESHRGAADLHHQGIVPSALLNHCGAFLALGIPQQVNFFQTLLGG